MNHRVFLKNLGIFSLVSATMFLPPSVCSILYWEISTFLSFVFSIGVTLSIGLLLFLVGRNSVGRLLHRESLALVGVGWLLVAFYGALPFFFSNKLPLIDSYFESMSGFTNTGASVLADVESWPKGLLFWRSFTHWIGGLGIILLLIIVLPFLGVGGKLLFRSEVPGVDKSGLRPQIKDSAYLLYKIYIALTVIMTLFLVATGMNLFDALCHTFGTLATGGFSTKNTSVAAFHNPVVELIIIVFMIIGGTNFGLLYFFSKGKTDRLFMNPEWRFYIILLTGSSFVITLLLLPAFPGFIAQEDTSSSWNIISCLRAALFQTVSIMTSTGYCIADFNLWPSAAKTLLVILMFVGGCSGSTAGGLKVIRLLVLLKMVLLHLERNFRPKTMRALRVGSSIITPDVQNSILLYFSIYVLVHVIATFFISLLGLPLISAFTAVVACFNNIGPGLELVGAVGNYSIIPGFGKLLLSFLMAMGRLELYAICVLFIPSFWKRY